MLILIKNYYSTDDIQIFNASSLYMQAEVLSLLKMQIQIAPVMQLYLSMPPDAFTDTVGKSSKQYHFQGSGIMHLMWQYNITENSDILRDWSLCWTSQSKILIHLEVTWDIGLLSFCVCSLFAFRRTG